MFFCPTVFAAEVDKFFFFLLIALLAVLIVLSVVGGGVCVVLVTASVDKGVLLGDGLLTGMTLSRPAPSLIFARLLG